MKKNILMAAAFCGLLVCPQHGFSQGTAFTYQGRLNANGSPVSGNYDLSFNLYSASSGGSPVTAGLTNPAVAVSSGLFTTSLDFGGVFDGTTRWLEIGARTNGVAGPFVTLTTRQQLTPSPYAIFAGTAGTANSAAPGSVTASSLAGSAVTAPSIANGTVVRTLNGLSDSVSLSAGSNVLITPNGNSLQISATGGGWALLGNAGTTPGMNFLGTADNQALELKVNGTRALRLEPTVTDIGHSNIVNLIGGSRANFVAPGIYGATISGGGAGYYPGQPNSSNSVLMDFGTVSGGFKNIAGGSFSTVAGGQNNLIIGDSDGGTISGGGNNTSSGAGTVGGGGENKAVSLDATVGGGGWNTAEGDYSTIAGGYYNHARSGFATVGGGHSNVTSLSCTVAGGEYNTASGFAGAIGGGYLNIGAGNYATISGGQHNTAFGANDVIAGGSRNTNASLASVIGGGQLNQIAILSDNSVVGGGSNNVATGLGATVSGGLNNAAYSQSGLIKTYPATVGGGQNNIASGAYSTVPGGHANTASGDDSFAAGRNASANHARSFIWSSYPNTAPTFGSDTFFVSATNGVGINFGTQRADGGGQYWMNLGNISGGDVIETSTGAHLTSAGVWSNASDKNRKTDFAPVSSREILEKLSALPVREWRYTNELSSVRHLGPTAQDFKAAFSLGTDDKSIGTIDEEGVALAAIQGLNQKVNEKESRIQDLEQRLNKLEQLINHQKGAAK